jgi:HEAT repeat protein/thiol-disulfide isomerase/thioredoxin
MVCLRIIAALLSCFAAICATNLSQAYAQESSDESRPTETTPETSSIFDAVIDLFGGSSSSETLQPVPEVATTPSPVPVPVPVNAVPQTTPPPSAEKQDTKVEIQTTYADAVRQSQLHNRPVLAVLGAEWCVWCRKLEAELETPAAESILKEWVVVKIDVDDEPEMATRLQASALPALRILGPFQALVASREGYVELAELKQWLAVNRASADPALHKVLYDTAAPDKAAVERLIEMLAQSSPMVRAAAIERLAAHPRRSADALLQTLKTGRLVQQLCACEVLRRWSAPLGSIDPWQPQSLETDEFAALLEWSRERIEALDAAGSENAASSATETEAAAATPQIDSPAMNELLARLMSADPIERPGLIAQLVGAGTALAPEIRSRLAQADAVDDQAREALRELLYNLLASSQLRLQQAGVIAALARLDSDSHRQAASTVLEQVAIIDQPLIDELVSDADPLVRELAVRALGRLGLLTSGDRIQKLLADSSPNVRTAVLRALAEHPSDQAVEALCAYLQNETDEDLLVHGAKCLGQLARQPQAMDTLAQLARNASWRVRATAIEAAGQAIQNKPQPEAQSWGTSGRASVPEALAQAIVAAAFEEDAFVAERAANLLPTLLNNGVVDEAVLESIAVSFAEHPEKLDSLAAGSSRTTRVRAPAARQQPYPALVNVATMWLAQDEPKNIERAAILLSRFDAAALNDRLGTLIASKEHSMRLAGLRAAIDSLEQYRRTSIETAVRAWRVQSDEASPRRQPAITPWYDDAGAATTSSKNATEPPQTVAAEKLGTTTKNQTARSQSSALDAAGEMFGDFPDTQTTSTNNPPGRSPADDPAARALPSKWMEHWQSGLGQKRPAWLTACEEPTKALLDSADFQERTAALALWLMLGHTDRTSDLLSAFDESTAAVRADELIAEPAQLNSWLPSEMRLDQCQDLVAANDADAQRIIETLELVTLVDDPRLAEWIFEDLMQQTQFDVKHRQALAATLLRALVGFSAETLPGTLSPGDFQFSAEAPYGVARSKKPFAIPGRIQACEWLRERYRKSSIDRQRAIALAVVARLDHKTAVDAALGAIHEAEADNDLLQLALTIALSDAAVPSARRAIILLDHKLPAVRSAALQLLAMPASLMPHDGDALTPTMDENPDVLPGFWRSTELFPVETLRDLLDAQSDASQQSRAILLLLAAGERINLAPLEQQLTASHGELTRLSVAAAIAKAERTDDEAIKYYEQAYAESSTRTGGGNDAIAAALYEILRDLEDDRIVELRRLMRKEKGSSLFNRDSTEVIFTP